MMKYHDILLWLAFALGLAATVLAAATVVAQTQMTRIAVRETFLDLVEGRELTRFGVTLRVGADGSITGRAFGRDVTGAWRWEDGYFCRTLDWGSGARGENCQAVAVRADRIRFVADRGAGDSVDLTLR